MLLQKKKIALISSLIGLVILIAGIIYIQNQVSYTANLDTRPINIGLVGVVESLEPATLNSHEEKLLASAIYEGLVYYEEESKTIKPLLARNWKYSADGKTITIELKNNVRFHNGKEFTAQDVKDSWEKNFSNTKEWYNLSLFMPINGAKSRFDGATPDIVGIQVVDRRTIKIVLNEPNAAFIYYLTHPMFYVMDTKDVVAIAPGTGPFVLQEQKDTNIINFEKYKKYHRGTPKLSAITVELYNDEYKAFSDYKAGKLDYLDKVPAKEVSKIKNHQEYKNLFINRPLFETYSIGFNVNREPYADNYLLRRAINYAIDRNAIIESAFGGSYRASKGVIPFGLPGYTKEMPGYTYNPEKAKLILDEAGYPLGQGLKPLILTYNKDDGHKMVALSIAEQLAQIGITVQIQEMDWDYYKRQLSSMNVTLFRISWAADYPDAESFLYNLFHSSKIGVSNFSGYHNQQVDKILEASRAETKSAQERVKLLNRAEEIIVDDAPFIWLFQKETAKLVGKNVQGLKVNGMEQIDWYKVELLKPSLDDEEKTTSDKKV